MALALYNGWKGWVRSARNKPYYAALDDGRLVVGPVCLGCHGERSEARPLGMHSEEYGGTVETYIAHCVPLCHTCHAIVHMRAKYPAVWRRYKQRIHDGVATPRYKAMFPVFQNIGRADANEVPGPTVISGGWLDTLPDRPYGGTDKIATVIRGGEQIPDPLVYAPQSWTTMTGIVVNLKGDHDYVTYNRTMAGIVRTIDPPF